MTPAAFRCYMISDDDDGLGYAIVAPTAKIAKQLGSKSRGCSDLNWIEWIDIRVRWLRWVDVSGLAAGHVLESIDGLERGAYSYAYGTCPVCGSENVELSMDERIACTACHDVRDGGGDRE